MITLLPALAACWAAAAPLEIGRPAPLKGAEGYAAALRPGYYAVFAETPFTMTGEDGQPGASSWHGGFHTAAFTIDKPERVTLAAGAGRGAEDARYQVFWSSVPFRLLWLSAGDDSSPCRPALEDPPQSAEITVTVETLANGVKPGPVSVGWNLKGLSKADVACPALSGRWSWTDPRMSRRFALCRTKDRAVKEPTTPFAVELTDPRGATLLPPGSLAPSSRPDAIRNR